eukprot:6235116-Prymnesium_polylepis.1
MAATRRLCATLSLAGGHVSAQCVPCPRFTRDPYLRASGCCVPRGSRAGSRDRRDRFSMCRQVHLCYN